MFLAFVISNLSYNRLRVQLNFHRLMIMLCFFDTIYVLLNILLFSLPKIWTTYEASGAHHFVLPKAIPFGKILIDFEGFE